MGQANETLWFGKKMITPSVVFKQDFLPFLSSSQLPPRWLFCLFDFLTLNLGLFIFKLRFGGEYPLEAGEGEWAEGEQKPAVQRHRR